MQIGTEGGAAWHFRLRDGDVTLHAGLHPASDFVQTWQSASEAVRCLLSSDPSEVLRAFEQGHCQMEGRFLVAIRFNELTKLAREQPLL